MSDFKDKNDIAQWLHAGEGVEVGCWYFYGRYMRCYGGCCDDEYGSIDEAVDSIMYYADYNIENVIKDV